MGCFPKSPDPVYQLVYVGKSGMPEFIQLHAKDDAGAEAQTQEFVDKNKSDLQQQGNAFVYLYKTVKQFKLI